MGYLWEEWVHVAQYRGSGQLQLPVRLPEGEITARAYCSRGTTA